MPLTLSLEFFGLSANTLPLEIPDKKLWQLEILQNCATLLGNFEAKNQDLWKFHMAFC